MLPAAKCRIDIDRTSHENPIVVCPDHERIPVAADQFAAIFFARRCGRDIHLVPIDLFPGEESNRPPQRLNAAGVGDLLKHPFHHAEPSVIRGDARLNHALSANHIEMHIVPSVLRNRSDQQPLSSSVSLTEWM